VSSVSEIAKLFDKTIETFGKIDIVVANAGIEKVNIPVIDVTEADFDLLFRVNTKGPYFVMQAAARYIADGGRIINIASTSTARPQPGLGLYGTSKTAPKYLVRVLALELGERKTRQFACTWADRRVRNLHQCCGFRSLQEKLARHDPNRKNGDRKRRSEFCRVSRKRSGALRHRRGNSHEWRLEQLTRRIYIVN
jgi:NAD(P)-dependent dehydrogenase (short-subunit alcohol dehydrogenase family)